MMQKTKKLIGSKLIKACIAFIMVFSGMLGLLPNSFEGISPTLTLSAASTSSMTVAQINEAEKIWKVHGTYLAKFRSTNTSKCVKALQQLLNFTENSNLVLDGTYGPAVEAAVKNFQKANKLVIDGCAGPKVWEKLLGKAKSKVLALVPTVSFSGISVPTSLPQGQSYNLGGTITSNTQITSFIGSVLDSKGTVLMQKNISVGSKSINIRTSAVNSSLAFGKLPAGNFQLRYTVSAGGKSFVKAYAFSVKANQFTVTSKIVLPSGKILNAKDVHIYQYSPEFKSNYACTLASGGMVFRSKLIEMGKSPSVISNNALWKAGWTSSGARYSYSMAGLTLKSKAVSGSSSSKESQVNQLLDQHRSGIGLYCFTNNSSLQHCVFLVKDINGQMYILDPAYSDAKFLDISQSKNSISQKISNVGRVYYID